MASAKLLMLVGDFVEDYEVMVPFQALHMVGHTVHAICPNKKAGQFVKTSIHDFEGDQTYTEKVGHNFVLNATFADVKAAHYDGLILCGGRSPEYLRMDEQVLDMVRYFSSANKPLAAICHGPQILAAAEVIHGKNVSCYPACSPEVRLAGGNYASVAMDGAVADGNLVTAPAWPALANWLAKFQEVLVHHMAKAPKLVEV